MLHFLPECHITHYGWFAADHQYAAAGLLGDFTKSTQHAEGGVYIKGLETDMELWGTTSPSFDQILGGKAISALLGELEERNPVYYRLYQLSGEPAPGTSWLDARRTHLEPSPSTSSWVRSGRLYSTLSWLLYLRRHPYVMVVYRALRYLCGLEIFP
jgi:hypothetical protein